MRCSAYSASHRSKSRSKIAYNKNVQTLVRFFADGTMILIVLIALYALVFRLKRPKDRYDTYTRLLMGGLTVYFAAKVIGSIWQPETLRPFEKLGLPAGAAYLNNPGFPSDHTLLAGFLVVSVWYATRNRTITLLVALITVAMAVGRVLALVHTPLDVVGGILIGVMALLWYVDYHKLKRLKRHKSRKISK